MRFGLKGNLLVCVAVLITSCTEPAAVNTGLTETVPHHEISLQTTVEEKPEDLVFTPRKGMSAEETVSAYFDQLYKSYIQMRPVDIREILDMEQQTFKNLLVWSEMLAQRRRLIMEHDLGYVETERFPYTIVYDKTAEDNRLEFWRNRFPEREGQTAVHFHIVGEAGKAYPPLMAVNAQHTMFLKKEDGFWKITHHYFPGSVRKFYRTKELKLPPEEVMLQELRREYGKANSDTESSARPDNPSSYNGQRAAQYADLFTETPNPAFYHIGDWMGNCANFVSQCVWYGFGTGNGTSPASAHSMTREWYAGEGGGSPAWENVEHFWNYFAAGNGMRGHELGSAAQLQAGDIVQTRPRNAADATRRFSHMLLVVDPDTLRLAQNSPGCFVYYSDLVNVDMRMSRPFYLNASDS